MTTQIVKTINPNGSGSDNFTNAADAFTYLKALDCVGLDQNVTIQDYIGVTWVQDAGPTSSSDTQRVTWTCPPGLGVNDLNKSALNVNSSTTGITVKWPLLAFNLNFAPGVDFLNLNLLIVDVGQNTSLSFKNHSNSNTFDNVINKCRYFDPTTYASTAFATGNNGNKVQINDSLLVSERPGQYLVHDTSVFFRTNRCTIVARGAAAGNAGLSTADYGGTVHTDAVLIGINTPGNGTFANSFTNIAPTSTVTGLTTVTTTGALVVNESTDFTPSASSPLIAAASAAAKSTTDILSANRGQSPDVGAKQKAAAPNKPTGAITSQPNPDGQNVGPITFSTTGSPTSATAAFTPSAVTGNTAVEVDPTVTLGTNTGTIPVTALYPGYYDLTITLTNAGGTTTVTGTTSFVINGASGNPQAPDPGAPSSTVTGVSVSPDGATVQGGASQQFTAIVAGTNSPSQSVSWSKNSGIGSISTTGLVTAPAATGTVQAGSFRATSIQDGTQFHDFTIAVPAATSPIVTGVTITPSSATVQGGTTQQFTASVQGSGNPSQSATWSKTNGVGAVVGGLYTAPVATSSAQTAVLRATSAQDSTYYAEVTVTIPAAGVTPTYATRILFGAIPEVQGDPTINATGLEYTVWAESHIGGLHTIIAQGNTLAITNGAGEISIVGQQVLLPGDTAYFIWGTPDNTMSGRGAVTVS